MCVCVCVCECVQHEIIVNKTNSLIFYHPTKGYFGERRKEYITKYKSYLCNLSIIQVITQVRHLCFSVSMLSLAARFQYVTF